MYAFLSDIHLGTKLPKMDYLKSLDAFLDIIKNHKEKCHAIIVAGDLFDSKLTIDESKFASVFLLKLVCNNCGKGAYPHVPVKFIHGTYSHDYDQYDIYLPMLREISNVDIFYTKDTCSQKLRNGASILYLPQMYGDIDYSEVLSNKYDIIVGHGPMSSINKNPCPAANYEIIHSADKLGEISKICVFGHYHEYTDFGNNVYYTGSMLRWKYGEDTQKVFFICDDNFNVTTYPNPFALEYKTISISDPEELRDAVSNDISTPHRFIINTNRDDLQTYHAIMDLCKKNKNITFKVSTNSSSDVEEETIPTIQNDLSHTVIEEPVTALISYINDKYNVNASEQIKEYETKINRDKKEE